MSKIAIIDANHILYYFNNGPKVLDKEGLPIKEDNKFVYHPQTEEGLYKNIDDYLKELFIKSGATSYIGILDGKASFRKTTNTEYKANRDDKPAPKFKKQATDYLVQRYKFKIAQSPYEADDIVSIIYNTNPEEYFIISPDKDLLNLEGTHFNPKKMEFETTSEDFADRFFWSSMITGDTADNIKGIPGKGPAFAKKLFQKVDDENTYRSLTYGAYVDYFGQDKATEEFHMNYTSLKILEEPLRNDVLNEEQYEIQRITDNN